MAGGGFSGDDEHADHCETTVLELGSLEAELFLGVGVGDVAERVEGAARVASLVLVELGRARELEVAHEDDFDPGQGTDGEAREREAQVLRLFELNLTGVRPGDARGGFRDGGAREAEHGPAGVKEFALTEAVDVEGFVVRLRKQTNEASVGRSVSTLANLEHRYVWANTLNRIAFELEDITPYLWTDRSERCVSTSISTTARAARAPTRRVERGKRRE